VKIVAHLIDTPYMDLPDDYPELADALHYLGVISL
jgi:hypothetical protein